MTNRTSVRAARSLALTVPGLGELLTQEAHAKGLGASRIPSIDRRSDLVEVRAHWRQTAQLACVEDVCVDLGTIRVQPTAWATATQLDRQVLDQMARELVTSPRRGTIPLRPVVRLSTERFFHRTALRDALNRHLGHKPAGGADLELWLIETGGMNLRVGIRVPGASKRQPRAAERAGALRPVVAAAMLHVAGVPAGGSVLDPCAGTGTILNHAARRALWATGGDLDSDAVDASRTNGAPRLFQLDARRLPLRRNSIDAVVTNLPFGHRHQVQGSPIAWYRKTLQEALRVAPVAVVLMPATRPFRQALGRLPATVDHSTPIILLGRRTTIWRVERERLR